MKLKSELCTQTILFREPSLKHYKYLLKSLYGESPDPETFVSTIIDIAADITNKPSEFFENLNIVDFFSFLLDWRILILGRECSVIIKQNDKDMKLSLNLDVFKTDLNEGFKSYINKKININTSTEIMFDCPSFSRLLIEPSFDNTEEDYLFFIKKAFLKQNYKTNEIEISNNKQAKLLFEKLLPTNSIQIIDHYANFVEKCKSLNFFERYNLKTNHLLQFVPTIQNIIWLCQLFFNESLSNIYDNLFYLSYYGKMDLNYIENSTVGEYIYFTNMLKTTINSKNESSPQPTFSSEDEQFNQSPLVDL
jgi:hypothetical protein